MRRLFLFALPVLLSGCNTTGAGDYQYRDVLRPHGRARGDAALQVDTRSCDRMTGGQQAYGTPPFNRCMRKRGWAFDSYTPAPDTSSDDDSFNAAMDAERRDDDARRNDESNRQLQQSIDDMNRTQDMINQQQMMNDQQQMLIQQQMNQ